MVRHKYSSLDSLRWVAAFSVGMGHALGFSVVYGKYQTDLISSARCIFNGAYAVDFFFVLSGFVLINQIRHMSPRAYTGYTARRFLRLYPAAWGSLLLAMFAALSVKFIHSGNNYNTSLLLPAGQNLIIMPKLDALSLLKVAILKDVSLNPVLWSIKVEIAASLLYPFFAMMIRSGRRDIIVFTFFVLIALSIPYNTQYVDLLARVHVTSIFYYSHFMYMFFAGASINLLAEKRPRSASLGIYAISLSAILMLGAGLFGFDHSTPADLISTISAALLIYSIAFCKLPNKISLALNSDGMVLLGQCSYSYYLMNLIVTWSLSKYFESGVFGYSIDNTQRVFVAVALGVISALVTIPLAVTSAKTIEAWSITFGRKLEAAISPRGGIAAGHTSGGAMSSGG